MTAISAKTQVSDRWEDGGGAAEDRRGRLLGVSGAAAADMRARRGKIVSTPVKTCGAAMGYANDFKSTRIVDIVHSGSSCALVASLAKLLGVLRLLRGVLAVFGVVRAEPGVCVAPFRGVTGARVAGAGRALSR